MAEGKKCGFCGRFFVPKKGCSAQKYCCRDCANAAVKKQAQDKKDTQQKVCVICGTPFASPNPHALTCCQKCSAELNRIKNAIRQEPVQRSQRSVQYTRKCHDSGKPTNDYRCLSCRKKWANKNHADLSDGKTECIPGWEYI